MGNGVCDTACSFFFAAVGVCQILTSTATSYQPLLENLENGTDLLQVTIARTVGVVAVYVCMATAFG